jgi:purine-binding chemotaxis protein CheW
MMSTLSASRGANELDENGYSAATVRCVLFKLDTEVYGINVKKIREVLRVGQIRKVPGCNSQVIGVINVRGVIVTVVDARRIYNLGSKEVDDNSRIVIIEVDEERSVGLMVDMVHEVKDIPESCVDMMSDNREGRSAYIQGVAHYQDNVIVLVDADVMFASSL